MRLIVKNSVKESSLWTANYMVEAINKANPTKENPFILGLPTGGTYIPVYKEVVDLYKRGKVSFENVITFNMDEYVALKEDHPESYHSFMWDNLFSHVNIKKENVHILNGNAKDLEKECQEYENAIKRLGGIDIFFGGIGADGHIAFNEPGSSLSSRTREMPLTQETILLNSRFFNGDISQVPKTALTVGVGTVMDAREVVILANGITKARALRHVIESGISHMWTLSCLQMHPQAIIACDEQATHELKVGTVHYFNQIESSH